MEGAPPVPPQAGTMNRRRGRWTRTTRTKTVRWDGRRWSCRRGMRTSTRRWEERVLFSALQRWGHRGLGLLLDLTSFWLCVPVSMDIAKYGTIESACSYQRDTWSVALETSVPPCSSYSRTLRLLQSPAVVVHGGSANQVTRPHQELCLPVSYLFYCYLCCDLDAAFALWACLSLPRRLSRPCRTT